jgi:transcription antitermination factor NusG
VSEGAKLYPAASDYMGIPITYAHAGIGQNDLRNELAKVCWYAAYTSANHEKKVAGELGRRSIENFLPLYNSVRRWKDRRVQLELPLFPGYVFVRLALRDRFCVLQVPGVARLVGFGCLPQALPDEQVESLRTGLSGKECAQPHPYLTVGRSVRVVGGPFQGGEGILVRKKGVFRVVLSLDIIMRSVSVEVDITDVEPLPPKQGRDASLRQA